MKHLFIVENDFDEAPYNSYELYDKDDFGWMPITETFNTHGQQLNVEDAGATSLRNSYCDDLRAKAKCQMIEKFPELSGVDFEITVNLELEYEDEDGFTAYIEGKQYTEFLENFEKANFHCFKSLAKNYWDGSNWKTIEIKTEHPGSELDVEIVDDELHDELVNAYESDDWEFVSNSVGVSRYRSGEWYIEKNIFAGDPSTATLYRVSDVEEYS